MDVRLIPTPIATSLPDGIWDNPWVNSTFLCVRDFLLLPLGARATTTSGFCAAMKAARWRFTAIGTESTLVSSMIDTTGCIGAGVAGRLEQGERRK